MGLAARLLALAVGLTGCGQPAAPIPDLGAAGGPAPGEAATHAVPGYPDRDYLVRLPRAGAGPWPVVFAFHGGGGDKDGLLRTTCPGGDEDAHGCLASLADREGFALVVPDGVDGPGLERRSWNAGGGDGGFRCVGGEACRAASDDVAYFDALLAEVARGVDLDRARLHAVGLSNGGAMSHRLACERADVLAAIASIAGGNQAAVAPGCAPSRPVPVLHVHGTADPCWGFDGAVREPVCEDARGGRFVSVRESVEGWLARNGCESRTLEAMAAEPQPDREADGTASALLSGVGCVASTALLRIEGGGHTWPGGWTFAPEARVGRVARDLDASALLWSFLSRHAR
jgi:polyhydroxybutyrate depolymerase